MKHRLHKVLKIVSIAMLVLVIGILNGANVSAKNDNNIQKKNDKENIEQNKAAVAFVDKQVEDTMYNQKQSIQKLNTFEDKMPEEDDRYIETDNAAEDAAAKWVNGVAVPMSKAEIATFLDELYACETQAEYEDMLDTLAYYNGGIDLSKFEWYWEDLKQYYTDDQIEKMRYRQNRKQKVLNVIGLAAMDAYNKLTSEGFIVSLNYIYDSNTDIPIDYCYAQDPPGGSIWDINVSIGLWIQAPEALDGESVIRKPDDEEFDIGSIAQEYRDTVEYYTTIPNVIGLSEAQAIRALETADLRDVRIQYGFHGKEIADGVCVNQYMNAGCRYWNSDPFYVEFNDHSLEKGYVSYLVGNPVSDCIEILKRDGFNYHIIHEYDGSDTPTGYCIWQEYPCQSYLLLTTCITIKVQAEPPQASATPQPTPEPVPEPSSVATSEPVADPTPEPSSEPETDLIPEPSTGPTPEPAESTDGEGQVGG